ncbi:hypothetical protein NDU88_004356 [Pleurodeles waltl]|uniref:Uncharacterized protein n=1 Tax=Pleurodeles waltl TaxID=8319 RepID=A0AAV7W816_PLEWA|nr:hypothetical protein NDU88_004356 [Pleurodeles waltl]
MLLSALSFAIHVLSASRDQPPSSVASSPLGQAVHRSWLGHRIPPPLHSSRAAQQSWSFGSGYPASQVPGWQPLFRKDWQLSLTAAGSLLAAIIAPPPPSTATLLQGQKIATLISRPQCPAQAAQCSGQASVHAWPVVAFSVAWLQPTPARDETAKPPGR